MLKSTALYVLRHAHHLWRKTLRIVSAAAQGFMVTQLLLRPFRYQLYACARIMAERRFIDDTCCGPTMTVREQLHRTRAQPEMEREGSLINKDKFHVLASARNGGQTSADSLAHSVSNPCNNVLQCTHIRLRPKGIAICLDIFMHSM